MEISPKLVVVSFLAAALCLLLFGLWGAWYAAAILAVAMSVYLTRR